MSSAAPQRREGDESQQPDAAQSPPVRGGFVFGIQDGGFLRVEKRHRWLRTGESRPTVGGFGNVKIHAYLHFSCTFRNVQLCA